MSLVFQCDRCGAVSSNWDTDADNRPTAPDNWRVFEGPVRGSEGARSEERKRGTPPQCAPPPLFLRSFVCFFEPLSYEKSHLSHASVEPVVALRTDHVITILS